MNNKSTSRTDYPVRGAGLGLRRARMSEHMDSPPDIDFMEVAPENWIHVGGQLGRRFRWFTERYPFVAHGLSLSLGSPAPLDEELVTDIRDFLDDHGVRVYSEHLSYCSDDGHLYDLMPIPFTEAAVRHCANRIKRVQEILERTMAIENVSYYAAPSSEMTESEFVNAVLEEADCRLMLDINNIYVNSINHGYDAQAYLRSMPSERLVYFHVAGHYVEAEDLRVDTHGTEVCDPVWSLLDDAYSHFGVVPTLLERDFNIPPADELVAEAHRIRDIQSGYLDRVETSAHG